MPSPEEIVAPILHEGISPPEGIPADIFAAALRRYLDCERIDVQQIAAELGVSRRTVWRKTGGRDALLGEILWFRTRLALADALVTAKGRTGRSRVVFVIDRVMRQVNDQPSLRRLLDSEPEIALRVLTSKHGPVQSGISTALARLLTEELDNGALALSTPASTMAFAIVRIAESFLYADVIGDNEPDVDAATEIIDSLLRGQGVTS